MDQNLNSKTRNSCQSLGMFEKCLRFMCMTDELQSGTEKFLVLQPNVKLEVSCLVFKSSKRYGS